MPDRNTYRLYEYGPTRSARCRWTLQELGLPFEAIEVDLPRGEHRAEAYHEINPFGRVPTLVHGDLVIFESAAICLYLADSHPDAGLTPIPGSAERALHDQWVFFCTNELEQPLWRIHRHTRIYPEEKRLPADVPAARHEFAVAAKIIQAALTSRQFLVGERLTVADILTGYTLNWSRWYGLLDEFPTLAAYVEQLSRRPAYPEVLRA